MFVAFALLSSISMACGNGYKVDSSGDYNSREGQRYYASSNDNAWTGDIGYNHKSFGYRGYGSGSGYIDPDQGYGNHYNSGPKGYGYGKRDYGYGKRDYGYGKRYYGYDKRDYGYGKADYGYGRGNYSNGGSGYINGSGSCDKSNTRVNFFNSFGGGNNFGNCF